MEMHYDSMRKKAQVPLRVGVGRFFSCVSVWSSVDMESVSKQNWRKGAENGFLEGNLPPKRVSFFCASENQSQQPANNSGARQVFDPIDEPQYG